MFLHGVIVGAGAAGGAGVRWAVGAALANGGDGWPWATLVVNLVGSMLAGALVKAVPEERVAIRLGTVTGFCGGLTTFSAFCLDLDRLAGSSAATAALYLAATAVGSLGAAALGWWAVRR